MQAPVSEKLPTYHRRAKPRQSRVFSAPNYIAPALKRVASPPKLLPARAAYLNLPVGISRTHLPAPKDCRAHTSRSDPSPIARQLAAISSDRPGPLLSQSHTKDASLLC